MNFKSELNYGATIKLIRNLRNLTQSELGAKVFRSRSSIANIENYNHRILLKDLVRFSDALGLELSDFNSIATLVTKDREHFNKMFIERMLELARGKEIQ